MSYNLLLETPSEILNIFALDEELNNLNLKSATVLVQKHSVSVINSETGLVYRHYDTAKGLRLDNISIVYVKDSKCFLVALSDSSLLLIPEAAKKSSEFTSEKLSFQPLQLYCLNGKDITVVGKDGQSCQFSLTPEVSLPSFAPTKSHTLSSSHQYVASCASSSHYIVLSESSKSKKGDENSASVTIQAFKSHHTLAGKTVWLDATSDVTTSTLTLKKQEKVFKVLAHRQGGSLSLIVRNDTNTTSRWIKVGLDGSVLFERDLLETPVAVAEVADQLWLTYALSSGSSRVSQWDVRFGVEVRSVNVSTPHSGASFVLPFGYCYSPTSTVDNAGGVTTCHLLVASPVEGGSATALFRHAIAADAQITRSTLCSAIGKLSTQSATIGMDTDSKPFNVSIYDDSAPKEVEGEVSGAEGGRVLAGLPGPMKRKLKSALHQYDAQMQLERTEYLATEDSEARVEKRSRRFYLDIPEAVSRAFLVRLESAKVSDLVSSDWEMVKVLVRSGTLSLASNPSLLSQASAAQRLDVLGHIVRHVPDLTERQCVKILHLVLFSSTAALNRVSVSGGVIQWGASATSSEPVAETKGKAAKKTKSTKTVAVETEAVVTDGDNRVLVLRAIVEAVMQRTAAFSAVLLSEAIRILSPSTCAVLLRVFAYTVRGLSSAVNDSDLLDVQLGRFGDEQLKRAVTWMEALLDAHFSATALQASVHAPTRRALTCAMKAVSSSESAAEEVEAAMGLWTHISRVMHHGSEQTRPIPGLYQVERLTV